MCAPASTRLFGNGCTACGRSPRPSRMLSEQRRPRLPCPGSRILPVQALCHPPLTSAHRGANGLWVRALAEVPGSALARRDRRRCRGGGGRQPWLRKHACQEGYSSVVRRANPGQAPVARRRHRGGACRGRGAERRPARARHRTASRAFQAPSCLRDSRSSMEGDRR